MLGTDPIHLPLMKITTEPSSVDLTPFDSINFPPNNFY